MKKAPRRSHRSSNPYRGFTGVFLREIRRFKADGPIKILLFAIAPLCCWLFCALYGDGSIKNLQVGICDLDRSALSRTIIRCIDATKLMRISLQTQSVGELKAAIASGKIYAGFYMPQRMEAQIKSGRTARVAVFRNGTNFLTASFIGRESQNIARTINAGLVKQRLVKSGVSREQALAFVSPIVVDASNLYNPGFSYMQYLCPGIVFSQVGLIIMIAGAVCFARERERATIQRLRHRAKNEAFFALHAKTAPYCIVIALLTIVIVFALFPLYGAALPKESLAALPSLSIFFAACWWLGAFLGILFGQVMLSAEACIFIGMPAFIFSGWTFPLSAAPPFMGAIAHAMPLTYFMDAWFKTARMNMPALSPQPELLILLGSAVFFQVSTYFLLKFHWKKAHLRELTERGIFALEKSALLEAIHA